MRKILGFIDKINIWTGKAVSFLLIFLVGAVMYEVTFCMVFIFTAAIVWKGGDLCYDALINNKKSSSILGLPLFPSMVMVPIGATLLGLQSLVRCLRALCLLFNRVDLNGDQ